VDGDVMISIDPHKTSNTAAVLDPATKTVIASQRFANTTAGYRQLRTFGDQWQQRRWAVEGCHGAGRFLAQHLAAEGELVLDVPAKLAARVRVYSQGHGRKTDADDAVSIGLAALNSDVVAAVRADDTLVSLRLLCDRRDELTALRTQAVCRLHRLLVELTPGGTHRGLRAARAQQLLAKLRPVDSVAVVRVQLAHQHLDDIRALDAKMKTVREQIAALVQQTGTRLTDLYGVGPLIRTDRGRGRGHCPLPQPASLRLLQRHRAHRRLLRRAGPAPALPSRQSATQPRPAHDGRDPDPPAEHDRPSLLRTQTPGGQNPERSAALPQTSTLRSRLLATRRRPVEQNPDVRITYDRDANAVYIRLTDQQISGQSRTLKAPTPPGVEGFIVLDWKDDRLVGIEVLDANALLPEDFLEQAEVID
jgi:uncharacterized protein YuzE